MPMGPWTIKADPGPIGDALRDRLGLVPATEGRAAVAVCEASSTPPEATHVVVTGGLTDVVDAWDRDIAPQTVAGALWLAPEQPDAPQAAVGWLTLRLQTPTTPLGDLTDNNGRGLRWSVAAGATVDIPAVPQAAVDPDEVKAWTDDQPQVQELGEAVARTGGETADAVLASVQRLREALAGLEPLGAAGGATPALDAVVAEHLRQVQRTGFGKWRGARARAASLAALQACAKDEAGIRLRQVMATREAAMRAQAQQTHDVATAAALRDVVIATVDGLRLPVTPDFDKVPRSWADSVPQPRRYVFVHEDDLPLFEDFPVTVRPADLPAGQVFCVLVQSGFSLPALR